MNLQGGTDEIRKREREQFVEEYLDAKVKDLFEELDLSDILERSFWIGGRMMTVRRLVEESLEDKARQQLEEQFNESTAGDGSVR